MRPCRYRRRERVLLGSESLDFFSCVLAGEGIMVHEVQCDECSIETLRKSFDCQHMSPKKRFVSGGLSQECVSCSKKGLVLDQSRSACAACSEKE